MQIRYVRNIGEKEDTLINYLIFHMMDPELAVEDLKELYQQKF